MAGAVVSVGIIAIGLILLLDNLGIIPGRELWDYFPALLVAYGLLRIVEAKGRAGSIAVGGIIAAAGAIWLLDNFGYIRFKPGMVWPLILIACGATMLARTLDRSPHGVGYPAQGPPDDHDSNFSLFTVFGGSKRVLRTDAFQGGDCAAIFGGIEVNLRDAKMAGQEAVIDINCMFGGVDLKIPADWIVVNKALNIFGGVEDKTNHPNSGPRLIVTGSVMFGGIALKN